MCSIMRLRSSDEIDGYNSKVRGFNHPKTSELWNFYSNLRAEKNKVTVFYY